MSQQRTVTCFISPGRIPLGTQAGTGRAVYGSIAAESCSPGLSNGAPHRPQNRFSAGLVAPHDGQAVDSGAPHSPQNFIPAGLSAWHREHRIPGLRRVTPGDVHARIKPNSRHYQRVKVTELPASPAQPWRPARNGEGFAKRYPKRRPGFLGNMNFWQHEFFMSSVKYLTLPVCTR